MRTIPNNGSSGRATRNLGRGGCHRKVEVIAAEVQVMGKVSTQSINTLEQVGRSLLWLTAEGCIKEHSRSPLLLGKCSVGGGSVA